MVQTAHQFTLGREGSMVMMLEFRVQTMVKWLARKRVPRLSQTWPNLLLHRLCGARLKTTTRVFSVMASALRKDQPQPTAIHTEPSPTRAVLRYPRQISQAQAAQVEQEAMPDKVAWTTLQAQAYKNHQSHPNDKAW